MDTSAQLIALSLGHAEFLSGAVIQVYAVGAPPRSTYIACGDNLVILDDDSAEIAPQTGASFKHSLGDIKIVAGIELKEELSTMIAARQLEQKIMTFMPAGIILLLRLSSPGFMDMLYGSPMGIAVMSAAVGLNILADYIGKRIVGRLETE